MPYALTPAQMREEERRAIEEIGIGGLLLMERAALALAARLKERGAREVFAVCGPGNNGGDGLALARLLHLDGLRVSVRLLVPPESLKGDARKNAEILRNLGVLLDAPWPERRPEIVVDAVFGTGLSRAPQGVLGEAIERINGYGRLGSFVLAVDIPSGVDGATGLAPGSAVQADETLSFGFLKLGHCFFPGRELSGRALAAAIGLPGPAAKEGFLSILNDEEAAALLPKRPRNGHKGLFGHGLLVAGSKGMAGAALLSASAALSGGIGLLSCAADEKNVVPILQSGAPGALTLPLSAEEDPSAAIRAAAEGKSAAAIGPGLGRSPFAFSALRALWEAPLPLLIDADGLNLLAAHAREFGLRGAETLLTPHPGEARRLLGRELGHPLADAEALSREFGATVLLKGASSVVASPDGRKAVNLSGSSALSRGGSGDVLTGLLLALLAQGLGAFDGARLGAYLHGRAAERLAKEGSERSMGILELARCDFFAGLEGRR
ncbi:MAG: NAD(P)H-hydrate dehydratase [Christensenellaceae bacterium]|jgi:NAD(P)H-hydrate epimerase|nr:NAD(P)H-hydrate dehydratase [Christensenellaceae bacterium]